MWRRYFKLVKLVPGKVIVQGYGTLDFSRDDIPVETCKALYETDFEFLEITEEGKRVLYGLGRKPEAGSRKSEAGRTSTGQPASSIEERVTEKRRTRKTKKEEVDE